MDLVLFSLNFEVIVAMYFEKECFTLAWQGVDGDEN